MKRLFYFLLCLLMIAANALAQTEAEIQKVVEALEEAFELYEKQNLKKAWHTIQPYESILRSLLEKAEPEEKDKALVIANFLKTLCEANRLPVSAKYYANIIQKYSSQPAGYEELNAQVIELYREGNIEEAIPIAEATIIAAEKEFGKQHSNYASAVNNLALLYEKIGDYARAEPLYQQALQIVKATLGENHPDYATALNNLAGLYEEMGDYARAEPLYLQAQDIRIQQLESTFPSLSEKEKERFLSTFQYEFELFHSFALRRKNPALAQRQYDNALLLKGILLQSAVQLRSRILASADTILLATFERWETYKRQWLNAIKLTESQRQQRGLDLTTLENTINELEKDLSRRSEAYA
ncbi:MAG: tetratricopeptide repeat protein, partial [Bernardetiaceae bacterium]|nr:tetratricopeptide repeat protein [Bernardetiaceae bacterium]